MHVETILKGKGNKVHTVLAGARISEAVALLNTHRIGAVVVVDAEGGVAGILSERDIVRHMLEDPAHLLDRPVSEVMTAKVISVSPTASIDDLMARMTDNRIRHLPIVDHGKLVGIISIGDVVKHKIEETEREALALREYIAS